MSSIRVELQLKDGSFVSGIVRAGQTVAQFQKELARTDKHFEKVSKTSKNFLTSVKKTDEGTRTLLSTMRDISLVSGAISLAFGALTGAAGGVIGDIIRVNAEMEKLRYQMMGMSTATDPVREAALNVAYLREQATKMPFSLKELSTTFVKLKATGIDPTAGSMQALADGIAAFGGTDEQLHRVTLGVTQMAGKSVIQMEEMRQQLGESMPNAMQIMARSMGITVSELSATIATGTLEAKSSLDKFYKELDRTYGGAAQRMMKTFSGQVAQLHANLQLLATGDNGDNGGMSGFFEAQKQALMELNQFLKTDDAKRFAKTIGDVLTGMVHGLQVAAQTAYRFRSEIGQLAKIIGFALVARTVVSSVNAMRASLALARVEILTLGSAFSRSSGHFAAGITSFVTMGRTARNTALIIGGARGALMAFGAGVMTFAPYIVLLGGAVVLLAQKMGLFGDKTAEAYEQLKKFGAESRAQAIQTLNDREKELRDRVSYAQWSYDVDWNAPRFKGEKQAALDKAKRDLETFMKEREEIIGKAEISDSKRAVEEYGAQLEEKGRLAQQAYQKTQVELDKAYAHEQARAAETGQSVVKIREKYQSDTLANQKKVSQSMIDIYDSEIVRLQKQITGATGYQLREIEDTLTLLRTKRMEAQNEMSGLGSFSVDTLLAPESNEDKVKKGAKLLLSLKDEVADLQAEMKGASGATAKLMEQIKRGDFGSIEEGGAEVEKLHKNLIAATEQKEALDKLMKGRSKAEADLEKIRVDILEREFKLKEEMADGKMNDADRFKLRLDNGYYEGLGPVENIRKAVSNVVDALVLQGDAQTEVGRSMRDDAFGAATVQKIDGVTAALGRTVDMLRSLNGGLDGLGGFGQYGIGMAGAAIPITAGSDNAKRAMDFFTKIGYSTAQASGVVGNLLAESGLDTRINGDGGKATGIAQWHPDRWNELLKFAAVHDADPYDLDVQLAFVDWELKNKETGAYSKLMAASTPYEATAAFAGFERPKGWSEANPAGAHNFGTRLGYANTLANQTGPTSPNPAAPAPAAFNGATLSERNAALVRESEKLTADYTARAEEYAARIRELDIEEKGVEAQKYLKELEAKAKGAKVETEELGDNYAKLVELVEQGKFGTSKNIDDYKDLAAAAKKLDEVEKGLKNTREAARAAEGQQKELERQRAEITQRLADDQARLKNPDYIADSNELRKLNEDLTKFVDNSRIAYGEDSQQYRDALKQKEDMLASHRQMEGVTMQADLADQTRDLADSLLTQSQLRQREMARELSALDAKADAMRRAGMTEVEITEQIEKAKALVREKYAQQDNPVTKQMKEWGDASGRLMDQTTQWLDSFASGMTGILTGKGTDGLKSAIDGMLNDVVSSAFKYLYSTNFGSKTASVAGKGLGPAAGGKKIPMIAHGGGIVGSLGRTRPLHAANWLGAPRFHSGGIIGQSLLPSEQAIVARKGEGVFTPSQMKALAPAGSSGMAVSINAPVTVNASGGTPEQNSDLATKISREIEGSMRGVVVDELRRQMRPGNMIGNMGRR